MNFANINLGKWIPLGFKIALELPAAIAAIEHGVKALKGKDKEDGAVEIVKTVIESAEDISDKDLLNNPAVEDATRQLTQATVNLQNVISAIKNGKFKA